VLAPEKLVMEDVLGFRSENAGPARFWGSGDMLARCRRKAVFLDRLFSNQQADRPVAKDVLYAVQGVADSIWGMESSSNTAQSQVSSAQRSAESILLISANVPIDASGLTRRVLPFLSHQIHQIYGHSYGHP
jgi:hypothetical protein